MFARKIADGIDVGPLLTELELVIDRARDSAGRKAIPVQRHTTTYVLINPKPPPGTDLRNVQEVVPSRNLHLFPLHKAWLDDTAAALGGVPGRAILALLPPEDRVYPHIDEGTYYARRNRYHLVLAGEYAMHNTATASEGFDTIIDSAVLQARELWWFDNKKMHGTINGASLRIALIFDVTPTS